MILGCVADDMTGATDLALMLVRGGLRTIQIIGVPPKGQPLPDADAIVVALKSRTVEPSVAVAETIASTDALMAAGASQLFFKYCSTFDSTDKGNIGPVIEAIMDRYQIGFTIACPAFPLNGRYVFNSRLFVQGDLLHESPMKDHPLTPMRDSNLVNVLQRQTKLKVGAIRFDDVDQGPYNIEKTLGRLQASGVRVAIADAISDRHLRDIGAASRELRLVTGGSGVAMGLPANFRLPGGRKLTEPPANMKAPDGHAVILAGSCSAATRKQIDFALKSGIDALKIDPLELADGRQTVQGICSWAAPRLSGRPILVYSSADPAEVSEAQAKLGRDRAGSLVEEALGQVSRTLVSQHDVRRIIVAGGETSGAVINALGVKALEIGPEIDPGVPWTQVIGAQPVAIALKSGNFGSPEFFLRAWERLQ